MITLKELLMSNSDQIQVVVGLDDLKELFRTIANESQEKEKEVYITINQAAQMLGVDRSTLWRWKNQNYLCPVKVGGKVRYRLSDVKPCMEG